MSDQSPGWEQQLASIEVNCKHRNWSGHGSTPVDERAIEAVRKLCASMQVIPTNSGGVVLSFANEDFQLELTDEGELEDFYFSFADVTRFIRPSSSDEGQGR